MRLLRCDRDPGTEEIVVSFEIYHRPFTPTYAILSHRWGEEVSEVTFTDIESGSAKQKPGYAKIQGCCSQALDDDIHHVWIDSCCIDKRSSAELSEAINSMYLYYKGSAICYAYLEDVLDEDPRHAQSTFRRSVWFDRGWTLQELLAPRAVFFLSRSWTEIGTKASLADVVESISGIEQEFFLGRPVSEASIAKRMSWAASRTTTRVEDVAYSLMGLFDINMPAIYGEGHKAFKRLQLEIIKALDDHTIFAWNDDLEYVQSWGMLAMHPSAFATCSTIEPLDAHEEILEPISTIKPHYESTNAGLHIWLPVQRGSAQGRFPVLRAALNCCDTRDSIRRRPIFLFLTPVMEGSALPRYKRLSQFLVSQVQWQYFSHPKFEELFIADTSQEYSFQSNFFRDISLRQATSAFPQTIHPYHSIEVDLRDVQSFHIVGLVPENGETTESGIRLPTFTFGEPGLQVWNRTHTVQLWNEATADMMIIHHSWDNGQVLLDLIVSVSDRPTRVATIHRSYFEDLHTRQSPSGLPWIMKSLPSSGKRVTLSAKEADIDGHNHRLRVRLKVW